MNDDFSTLLRRAKEGEAAALTELYARYERLVIRMVRLRIGPVVQRRYDADDIVQSVFADVLGGLPAFEDRGEEAFRSWLCIQAESKVWAKLRRQLRPGGGRREETPSADPAPRARGPGPATEAGDADDHRRLGEILGTLDPGQREVLSLRDAAGLDFREIAERLGLRGADAARMRYARALLALRRRWNAR